ncbi:unnamed protein product [Hydatigera taeniaeformis]|uniref:EXS domain-containing protein n=1 Tax=Hydatigena taeniaeformis TaxID=6205 RepID=A0A0R3X9E5_HYDTA|nr:unnamed protein product [Hydatigera taeniaeformis]
MWGLQPILKALPAWWRFLQCLRRYRDLTVKSPVPHLMNAGKYSTTLIAIVCSVISSINHHTAFFVLMILSKLCSSVCTTTWDLVMDWGLLDCSSKENMLLRDELVYRFRAYYYGAILEDVIIRFAWILPIVFSHFRIVDVEVITTIVMFAEVTRRIIWNFFRLENEHLNNCGNFRAVRDIGIAPIRKETSPPPVTQEGDKAYGMFGQLYTLNRHNNNDGSNDNQRDNNAVNQGFDAGGSAGGGITMENAPLPSTLAEYATMLRQNNHKSLWNHLRENYLQTKREKRRRLDFDRIVSMEEALRAAKMDVESKLGSPVPPPRGATPTRDSAKVHARLCEKVQQLSSTVAVLSTSTTTQQPGNDSAIQPPPLLRSLPQTASQGKRSGFVSTCPSEGARSRCIVVDGRQRKALTKPQQSVSGVKQPGDLSAFLQASDIPQPSSGATKVDCSLDPVITSKIIPNLHSDESPGDTVLPVRTSLLASRLHELLSTFNRAHSTATVPSSSSSVMMASGGGSRPKCRPHDTVGGHQIGRIQTTKHRRLGRKVGNDEVESGGGLAAGRSGDFGTVVRLRSVSVVEPSGVDSDEEAWDVSIDLNAESSEDVSRAQLYVNLEFVCVCSF